MTHIYERLFLRCPYVRAREYLREALESAALAFEKHVLLQFERGQDPLHFNEPWNVHWIPEGGGPDPKFSGELAVRADQAYCGAVLELCGEYAPPSGKAARAFDMSAGTKIASNTARKLLERIASLMENRYLAEP